MKYINFDRGMRLLLSLGFIAIFGLNSGCASLSKRALSKPFTIIVLPDNQGYADTRHKETQKHWPGIGDQRSSSFTQTEWIKKNRKKLNIALAAHVGDITKTGHDEEWKIADTALMLK